MGEERIDIGDHVTVYAENGDEMVRGVVRRCPISGDNVWIILASAGKSLVYVQNWCTIWKNLKEAP